METVATAYVAVDPAIRGGRPHLAGSRITVADVVLMHLRLGQATLEEIAGKHDLPLAAVHAAMAYYCDHRAEIDRAIEDDDAFQQAFRRNNPSPLREKLTTTQEASLRARSSAQQLAVQCANLDKDDEQTAAEDFLPSEARWPEY